jgi:hypothetical protein
VELTTLAGNIVHALVRMHARHEGTIREAKRIDAKLALAREVITANKELLMMQMKQTFDAQVRVIDSLTRVALVHPDSQIVLKCLSLLENLAKATTIGDAATLIEAAIVKHHIPLHVLSDAGLLLG